MTTNRLLRIERKLMAAEYRLDSLVSHVRNVRCGDVRPKAMRRVQDALNEVRSGIQLVRLEQGFRHPTLFAGNGPPGQPGARGQIQKRWGPHKTPHSWPKDCQGEPDYEARALGAKGALVFR